MQIKKYGMLLAAALALTAYTPGWTEAKVVVVDAAGNCTLPEAVSFIFDPGDGPGCVDSGGGGADNNTIILMTDVVLEHRLNVPWYGTIEGHGHTVTGIPTASVFLVNYPNTITLNNITVRGGHIGIEIGDGSKVILNNSTVSDNTGRGIAAMRGSMTLNNSTVSGNGREGVTSWRGGIRLKNSTVSGNAVGVYAHESGVHMQGSVVSGNSGLDIKDAADSLWETSFNVLGHSGKTNEEAFSSIFMPSSTDRTATSDGTRPTALADILSPLADNGGLTQTHALPEGSPAIDLDANCSASLWLETSGTTPVLSAKAAMPELLSLAALLLRRRTSTWLLSTI